MDKKGMGLIPVCFFLLMLGVGFAVQQNSGFDVQALKNNLTWTEVNFNIVGSPDLGDALESMVNGLGSATYSMAKWMAEWSSEHPTVPFKLLIWGLLIAILAPIIILIFKLGIIIFLLTKEYFQNKKEKKELNKLKNG